MLYTFVSSVQGMTPTMIACISEMFDKWQTELDGVGSKEIDVHKEFKVLTADIIAHTAFGSSYEEGKVVFKLQHEQQEIFAKVARSIYIPGSRYSEIQVNLSCCTVSSSSLMIVKLKISF